MFHSEILHAALAKYREDSDIEILRSACSEYASRRFRKDLLPDLHEKFKSIIRGFNSFNIAPSNSYERYMDLVENKSDTEAIASDWEAVGEYLTYALAQHIIEKNNAVSGENTPPVSQDKNKTETQKTLQ